MSPEGSALKMKPGGLQPGDEVKCPHCHEWHRVDFTKNREAIRVESVRQMLYFFCGKARTPGIYYAGAQGTEGKLERRRDAT